jgi:hypothetical protein
MAFVEAKQRRCVQMMTGGMDIENIVPPGVTAQTVGYAAAETGGGLGYADDNYRAGSGRQRLGEPIIYFAHTRGAAGNVFAKYPGDE